MSGRGGDSDSDDAPPEEFTSQQGFEQDEEITRVQKENKARVVREGRERRQRWAQKLTPRPREEESIEDVKVIETEEESHDNQGTLPEEIVKLLAASEKKVFSSDSEEEKPKKKPTSAKKRIKQSGLEPVILEEIPPAQCLQSSLEFLKKRKMQISRSSAVLNNSDQALRFLSTSGVLSKK